MHYIVWNPALQTLITKYLPIASWSVHDLLMTCMYMHARSSAHTLIVYMPYVLIYWSSLLPLTLRLLTTLSDLRFIWWKSKLLTGMLSYMYFSLPSLFIHATTPVPSPQLQPKFCGYKHAVHYRYQIALHIVLICMYSSSDHIMLIRNIIVVTCSCRL